MLHAACTCLSASAISIQVGISGGKILAQEGRAVRLRYQATEVRA